jgi:hypothetical protein
VGVAADGVTFFVGSLLFTLNGPWLWGMRRLASERSSTLS